MKLVFVFLLICMFSFEAKAYLVRVESTYENKVGEAKSQRSVEGVGTIVNFDGKTFVLTAAHVSQGQNLRIADTRELFRVISDDRLANNDSDLELIRIEAPTEGFSFDDRAGLFLTGEDLKQKEYRIGKNAWLFLPKDPICSVQAWETKRDLHRTWNTYPHETDRDYPHENWTRHNFVSSSSIAPGFSGAPLLSTYSHKMALMGIAKQYDIAFERSHFVSATQIEKLVKAYRTRKSGQLKTSPTSWKMRNGLTFRVFADGFEEIVTLSAGRGTRMDGGRGTTMDGSDSLACSNPSDALTIWEKLDIAPGMLWNHEPALAVEVETPHDGKFYVAADENAIAFKEMYHLPLAGRIVKSTGDLLLPLLRERLKKTEDEGDSICRLLLNDSDIKVSLIVYDKRGRIVDHLEFNLDAYGRHEGSTQPRFVPLIRLKNKYIVDISGLFYVDLGQVPAPSSLGAMDNRTHPLRKYVRSAYITIRGPSHDLRESTIQCRN